MEGNDYNNCIAVQFMFYPICLHSVEEFTPSLSLLLIIIDSENYYCGTKIMKTYTKHIVYL